jgi:hypothetical protein
MSPTRSARRIALGLTIGAVLALGTIVPAGAGRAPRLVVTGDGEWFTHPVGWYEVILGSGEVEVGKETFTGDLVANIRPDDHAMPEPGACERGMTSLWVEGASAQLELTGVGDVCAHHPQEPTSVVVYSFTGDAYATTTGTKKVPSKIGFLDIRMALDGRASVFATVA